MELYLQTGWGMQGMTIKLLQEWGGGKVILSPRDLEAEQLEPFCKKIRNENGEPLLDPQCFLRDSDHARLLTHKYWKEYKKCTTSGLLDGTHTKRLLSELRTLAEELELSRHILPGLLAEEITEEWFLYHELVLEHGESLFPVNGNFQTIALSSAVMGSEHQIESLLDRAESWKIGGIYLIAESPVGYLVDDPAWLSNLLILVSGLRLQGKYVLVGHSSHQMLSLATAGTNAIASGNYLNVRSFSRDKLYEKDEGEVSRRSIWYYCPKALSEYKISFLDLAYRNGILDRLKPSSEFDQSHCEALFKGPQPSSVQWKEPLPFIHYLSMLRTQCQNAMRESYELTKQFHEEQLDECEKIVKFLKNNAVLANDRDFSKITDTNRAALTMLDKARGLQLKRKWN